MDDSSRRPAREGKQALRRLQQALRNELRTRSSECRYSAACPVMKKGNCPGIC